ncbi:MAG: hypothetical protein HYU28_10310 [Actinobacteria bacterium]|nr:hypothetical protein [Actinomycetota bacterium]
MVEAENARHGARSEWSDPYPFEIYDLEKAAEWERLTNFYSRADPQDEPGANTDRPLLRCIEVAREGDALTAVVETRYIDLDYRSEYSAFYSKAFTTYDDATHRVHFFSNAIGNDEVWRLPEGSDQCYLGYMIIRPQVRGSVGRTMLCPPPDLKRAVRTAVREEVHFFGQTLQVRAVPFIQQDGRFTSCAHAAAWMCHYSAFRSGSGVARRAIAEFCQAANPGLGLGRTLPSTGLTLHQMSELLGAFGLPPLHYEIDALNDSDRPDWWKNYVKGPEARVTRVCCRYLNSGAPVIAVARARNLKTGACDLHALAVCGYRRNPDTPSGVSVIVNDDRRGPYLEVFSVLKDVEKIDDGPSLELRWEHLLAPLPEKLWMSGEAAERFGCDHLVGSAEVAVERVAQAEKLLELDRDGHLTVRTYATSSNRFKERLKARCPDDVVVSHYMLAGLPKYVWVVEAVDRRERGHYPEKPSVLGEVVFDATSDDHDPSLLAVRLPGLLAIPRPDDPNWDVFCGDEMITSGGQFDP